jgi:flagellum-specific peptidoglycan hydrolase FlgJ
VAPTIKGLAGTWAADPKYAGKIVRIANEIRKVSA